MLITDSALYGETYDELELDRASVDDIQDKIELSVAFDMDVGVDIAVFQCPFIGSSDCEYVITDIVTFEEDILLVKSAAAAHLAIEHGSSM